MCDCLLYSVYLHFTLHHLLLLYFLTSLTLFYLLILLGPVLIPAGGETLLFFLKLQKPSSPPETVDHFHIIFFYSLFELEIALKIQRKTITTQDNTRQGRLIPSSQVKVSEISHSLGTI